jgi:large subunit ribosomal protein L15
MQLDKLPKIITRKSKRVGRGIGSGKGGHTSSRGAKGQKSREKVPQIFEGTKAKKSFIKRIPLLRGRGKFKPRGKKNTIINLHQLGDWPEKLPVTVENLIKQQVISRYGGEPVKLLGLGEIKRALEVKIITSAQAAEKIEKAGGKVWKNS